MMNESIQIQKKARKLSITARKKLISREIFPYDFLIEDKGIQLYNLYSRFTIFGEHIMAVTEKVTLTLPKDLMENIRELVPTGGYSKFVAEAVEYFIETKRRQELRERLIHGYQVNAIQDAAINAEWEAADDEAWLNFVSPYEGEEPTNATNSAG